MKLAEALINRADAQKRLQQMRERLLRVVRVQQGDKPAEDPKLLMDELNRTLAEYTRLVKAINRTNAATPFSGHGTLTDAIANREALQKERDILFSLVQAASEQRFIMSRTEVRYVNTVNVGDLQKQIDTLAKRHRELDTGIQQLNWQVDLIETP